MKFAPFLLPVCVVAIAVNLDEPSCNFEFLNQSEMFVDKETIFYNSNFHCPNNYIYFNAFGKLCQMYFLLYSCGK